MDESEMRVQLEQHHAASYGWALNCCSRRPAEAEDVLQTAYMKILQGRAHFAGRSNFKTWLFSVIRNTAADERRGRWLRALRLAAYTERRENVAESVGPDRPMEESERLTVFHDALQRLPRRQQEVLHLAFYQDLSLQEAATVMGVSLGSARKHYERGKARLKEWLKPEDLNES